MNEIVKTKQYIEFKSSDENGEFILQIQKDGSQIRLEREDDYAFIDVNLQTIKAIRDIFNEIIHNNESNP